LTRELLSVNIKEFRKKMGLSQEKLAEAADLSAQTISDIEGCRTWVSDKTLERLAQVLNVDIFELFMPSAEEKGEDQPPIFYNRLMKLRSTIKEDIDKRLDQFYLSEKEYSK
jgi:transcriptional regulator with XRE-family HTH domain